ncbi:MAG: NapH/MauN family ferredoxin-type protein [Gammaproteobacteria bacterium]|nr:NapH/MauN family ferredoxin-type protein [Gammaproteobacteria bacterium]
MSFFTESFMQLMGRAPTKPDKESFTPEAQKVHFRKKGEKFDIEEARRLHAEHDSNKWRRRRWITLIFINVLFLISYKLDIQLLEGALTASRFLGFHMADLNSALQVMLAYKQVLINLLIGTVTVLLLWLLLGGRTFCSWVCPYHLLAEWTDIIHLKLVAKGWVKDHDFHRGTRSVLYLIFVLLALITNYTVYETISPTGIISRALIYGPGLILIWVAFLLLIEIFYSRRFWCRYACPIGLTYGLVGQFSPFRVKYNINDCKHEGDCRKVCLVPHVLDTVIKGRAQDVEVPIGADCTRCGLCIDTCPTSSLRFDFKGLNKIL